MLAEDFIANKKQAWERLTALISKSRTRGLTGLTAEELSELGNLYRSTTSDLAIARRDYPTHRVTEYLNGLVAQAHGTVYQSRAHRRASLLTFFTHTFPRTFRETWAYTLAAFLMFLLPAIFGYIVSYRDPDAGASILGLEGVIRNIRDQHEWWQSINEDGRSASASFIMTNNIGVAFRAFAGGILFGIFTLYIMIQNGLMLGIIAGASHALGFAGNLWGFVAAHGTIELSMIFLSGGAGMQLGWALLRPGLYTRRAALVLATRRALNLLLGCVPLLIIAGIIEGFISPSPLPFAVKLIVSIGSGILLYSYLILAGRNEPPQKTQ
jgi:uncharacterized membrane protein SpoIIM required for sporulation